MDVSSDNIKMRLDSVSELGFSINPGFLEEGTKGSDIQLGFSTSIDPDIDKNTIALTFGVRFLTQQNTLLEAIYKFVFSVLDLSKLVQHNEDGSITVDHIIPHFLSVAVGTMRGVLVVKTAGTSLSKYLLPMVDVNQLCKMLSSTDKK